MTDLEKFVELYKSVGIDVKVRTLSDFHSIELTDSNELNYMTKNDKIVGFNNLYTKITFDKNKKFINQGIWENIT